MAVEKKGRGQPIHSQFEQFRCSRVREEVHPHNCFSQAPQKILLITYQFMMSTKVFSLAATSSASNSMEDSPISSFERHQFGRTEEYLELSLHFSANQHLGCLEECGPQSRQLDAISVFFVMILL